MAITSSKVSATMIFPLLSIEALAISERNSCGICTSNSSRTASASSIESVTSTALAILSCSAWESKSAAAKRGFVFPSATIKISLGPAIISIETWPNTCFFASATNALPGPTILSTFGTDSVPYANAAIACAPPTLKILSIPAILAAARMTGLIFPSAFGGVTITTSLQPAILAGMESISTVEG